MRWTLLLACCALAGCDAAGPHDAADGALLTGGPASVSAEWSVAAVGDERRPAVSTGAFSVTFAASGTLSGMAACSVYDGSYSAGEGDRARLRLRVASVEALPTFAPCTREDEVFARRLLAALPRVQSFARDGEGLVLRGDGDAVHLRRSR